MSESRGISTCRWLWTVLWATLAAVGGWLNIAVHGWSTTIGVVVVVAAICAGYHFNRADRPGRKRHEGLATFMGVGVIASVATGGWVTTLGPGALLLPLVAVLSWPGTYTYLAAQPRIRAWRGHLDQTSTPPDRPTDAELGRAVTLPATPEPASTPIEPTTPVTTMTDEQLRRAWRASYKSLEHSLSNSDTAQQAQLINRRRQYLDEFEHRNPHGFARWLASGAQPAGDPSRFS